MPSSLWIVWATMMQLFLSRSKAIARDRPSFTSDWREFRVRRRRPISSQFSSPHLSPPPCTNQPRKKERILIQEHMCSSKSRLSTRRVVARWGNSRSDKRTLSLSLSLSNKLSYQPLDLLRWCQNTNTIRHQKNRHKQWTNELKWIKAFIKNSIELFSLPDVGAWPWLITVSPFNGKTLHPQDLTDGRWVGGNKHYIWNQERRQFWNWHFLGLPPSCIELSPSCIEFLPPNIEYTSSSQLAPSSQQYSQILNFWQRFNSSI